MPDFGASIWGPLLFAGASAGASALNNKKSSRTGENSGTSTTTRNLLPWQEGLVDPLVKFGTQQMTDPAKFIEPYRAAGVDRINRSYQGAPEAIAKKMLAFGGSKSGKFGTQMRRLETSRMGDVANFEGSVLPLIMQQQNEGASLISRLLGENFGQTTKQEGTVVQPGSALGGALSGGLNTLTTLLTMQKLLGGTA